MQDKWRETDGSVCLQRCACPDDGGACSPDDACSEGSFVCKRGYQPVSSGEQRCYLEGCQEGSLQVCLRYAPAREFERT